MKVCGKKDIHVPECDDCQELEERVDAVEKCCDDAHEEIDTLATDKADKDYVDLSIENVNETIEGEVGALNERIDNIITSSEPSVTTLWEGVMESIGDSANLSEDVNDFDYLDIYYRTSVDESEGYYNTVRIPADQFANYTITVGGTLSPLGESPNLSQYLTQLSFVDDTATIDNIREWSWNGSQSTDAADDPQALMGVSIYRIDGIVESGCNLEIADAREGVDGTIYPSLGDAIREQIQDTRDMIQPCPVQDVQVNGTSVVDAAGIAHITMPELVKTVNGNPIVLDDAFGEVKNLDVELTPIQAGSGTPSPSNVRPITGHDSVTVTDTGINQWDEEWEVGGYDTITGAKSVNANVIRCKNPIPVFPSTTYYANIAGKTARFLYYGKDGSYITFEGGLIGDATFTTPANAYFVCFYAGSAYGNTYHNDISINLPSTDTDYHAYHGQSKTVTLPHTVYGAGVGVTSGSGLDKMGFVDGGDLTWYYYNNNIFYAEPQGMKALTDNIVCSSYVCTHKALSQLANGEFTTQAGNGKAIWVKDTAYTDATAFTTAMSGVQICYELATPTDLSTTPTDITLYNGDNVVSSDGDITMDYVQDIAIVIRKLENQ